MGPTWAVPHPGLYLEIGKIVGHWAGELGVGEIFR